MPGNQQAALFRSLLRSAREEASRRGDRRIGTEHLLLGLLHDESSLAASALGVSLGGLRAKADALDLMALAAVGVEVDSLSPVSSGSAGRRFPPLTSGARAVLRQASASAKPRRRGQLSSAHFLLALLELRSPDPAAALLDEIGIDRAALTARLRGSTAGEVA